MVRYGEKLLIKKEFRSLKNNEFLVLNPYKSTELIVHQKTTNSSVTINL